MKIKSLLLGSAAALVAVSGARAADAVIIPEPEAVEYVRVCDAAGTGFFYIPGTETCLRVHGYVRYDITVGQDDDTWTKRSRFNLRVSTYSDTSLGALRTYTEMENDFTGGAQTGFNFNHNYIDLAGLRIGYSRSLLTTFTGYGIGTDWGGNYGFMETNLIQYNFAAGAVSGAISLEERAGIGAYATDIDDFMPHVVAALGYDAGAMNLRAVAGYDSVNEAWAGKVRADWEASDAITLSLMGLYTQEDSAYGGAWVNGGDTWSVIGGFSAGVSDNVTANAHVQWIQGVGGNDQIWNAAANIEYDLEGLLILPEVSYTAQSGDGEWGALLRFQRSF